MRSSTTGPGRRRIGERDDGLRFNTYPEAGGWAWAVWYDNLPTGDNHTIKGWKPTRPEALTAAKRCIGQERAQARKRRRAVSRIPDYVAAYAAALHDSGAGTWFDVASIVAAAGLGRFEYSELASAACAWRREHVSPAVRTALRKAKEARRPRFAGAQPSKRARGKNRSG